MVSMEMYCFWFVVAAVATLSSAGQIQTRPAALVSKLGQPTAIKVITHSTRASSTTSSILSTITTTILSSSSISTTSSSSRPTPTHFNRFVNVTWEEFTDAFVSNKFPAPNKTHYADFVHGVELYGNITSKREAAMFLAQLLHESGGLRYIAELRCVENPKNCINDYRTPRLDIKGKQYYGRGYIQLTWAENYLAASKYLFGDDRLLKDPDSVANNERLSWDVSFWYWKARVGVHQGIHRGEFGVSTMMINGGIECGGKPNVAAISRFQIYGNVLLAFGIDEKPNPIGCKRRIVNAKYGPWALQRRRF